PPTHRSPAQAVAQHETCRKTRSPSSPIGRGAQSRALPPAGEAAPGAWAVAEGTLPAAQANQPTFGHSLRDTADTQACAALTRFSESPSLVGPVRAPGRTPRRQ